jgi:uncharacterized protein (TIGR02145 family)
LKENQFHIIKIFYVLIVVLGFGKASQGQLLLDEDFSSQQMPPEGWSIDNVAGQWSIGDSDFAGGTTPEALFTWLQLIDTTRLISAEIDLTGFEEITLRFMHMYDHYIEQGPAVGVATRSGGSNWISVWEINPTANVGPEQIDLTISNINVGQADFQVCFYVKGNFWNLNYWYLDDISLFVPMKLQLKLYLEGPFMLDGMKNNLNEGGLLPSNQPYFSFPWNYCGMESVTPVPGSEVIDWVLVDLITIENFSPLTYNTVRRQAGLLHNDGNIHSPEGNNHLKFTPPDEDSLYVMIHHRNHLAVISSQILVQEQDIYNYDFTNQSSATLNGVKSMKKLAPGKWGTLMGDGNVDGQINNHDKNDVWYVQKDVPGYYPGDFNMDGFVNDIDLNERWKSNAGRGNRVTDSIAVPFVCGDQFYDNRNGEYYETVQIGSQCWMAENLNYETGNSWCYYNSQASCDTLGRLYNWNTIMNGEAASNDVPSGVRGICPQGWHLPSDAEWCILTQYIDPTIDCEITGYNGTDAGTKMKSKTGWSSGGNGTNESGFNAQAGGSMGIYHFDDLHLYAYIWSCTEDDPGYAWYRKLSYGLPSAGQFFISKTRGCSVRCVSD